MFRPDDDGAPRDLHGRITDPTLCFTGTPAPLPLAYGLDADGYYVGDDESDEEA